MAHNLATIASQVAMLYQGQTPWHSLGTRITQEQGRNLDFVLQTAKLDYSVELQPVFLQDGRQVPGRNAVVRVGDDFPILGDVGDKYRLVQGYNAAAVLRPAIEEHGVTIAAAGALGHGERAWILGQLPYSVEVMPGDDVRGYFAMQWTHDGSAALTGRPTPIRGVCQNTLDAIMANGRDSFIIRHTASADDRIKEAGRMVASLIAAMKQTGDTFRSLAAKRLSAAQVASYIESVFPEPARAADAAKAEASKKLAARRAAVAHLAFFGVGADMAGADERNGSTTVWGAYNAVTEYFDHLRSGEAKSDVAKRQAQESALFGANRLTKQLALSKARELVTA